MILFISIMSIILIALFIVFATMLDLRKDNKTKQEKVGFTIGLTILIMIIIGVIYIIARTLMEGNIIW